LPKSARGEAHLLDFIERLTDPEARKVFEILYNDGSELSEVEIAEKAGMKANTVRRALNILAEHNLAVYRRIRDPATGRIVALWQVNYDGLLAEIESRKRGVLERLRALLEHEKQNYFYVCPRDGTRYTFDEALEQDFTCPRCGSPLDEDRERDLRIRILESYVRRLGEELDGGRPKASRAG
jgi:transcription initiation factor TFIIE subunit alpha